jgi:hypothetical protein
MIGGKIGETKNCGALLQAKRNGGCREPSLSGEDSRKTMKTERTGHAT